MYLRTLTCYHRKWVLYHTETRITARIITTLTEGNNATRRIQRDTLQEADSLPWYHNHDMSGIADINGQSLGVDGGGLRLMNGEIQIIPYGNSMKLIVICRHQAHFESD